VRRFLASTLCLVGACRGAPPGARRVEADAAPVAVAPPDAAPTRPNGFVGSAACLECHGKQRGWRHSWHARALSPATPEYVVAAFDGRHFHGTSTEAWMRRRGGRYLMRTRSPEGVLADFPVDWVIGGEHMQDTITVFPDGRWQVLPVYWHASERAWVDYTEEKQGALTPGHPFFWANFRRTANRECLDCHTTGLEVTYDRSGHRFSTRFADPGVACESCHGPGARHAESSDGADIVDPKRLPPDRALAVCASCHGPRETLFPILDASRRFRPGDAYDDHYVALEIVDGLARSGDFFADGRPRTSSYEHQALIQSPCHRKGGAHCLTCHAAGHGDAPQPDELRVAADDTCRACHAPLFAAGAAHTRHAAKVGCVDCHMPPTVTGVRDRFADHAIEVPVPANTVRHGVPNACNACHTHAAESPEVTAAALVRLWPGAAARQARRLRLADAIDEKTAAGSERPLLAVLADTDEAPTLRGVAALLLAQRFPRNAVRLAPLAADPAPLLRLRAVEALGQAHAGVDVIAAHIGDESLPVRHAATIALANLGDPRAEAGARSLVEDPWSERLPAPHLMLGILAVGRGDLETAEREVDRAVELQPYRGDALVALAWLAEQRGDHARAQELLRETLRFEPDNRLARRRLDQPAAP
jgi:hypothetical protein